jgi:hypothetical protein
VLISYSGVSKLSRVKLKGATGLVAPFFRVM